MGILSHSHLESHPTVWLSPPTLGPSFSGTQLTPFYNPTPNCGVQKVRNKWGGDTKDICTISNRTGNNAMSRTTPLFNWTKDTNATITPTPIIFVAPVTHTPHSFSDLHLNKQNPWSGLSWCHQYSYPCIWLSGNSLRYSICIEAHKTPIPVLPVPPPAPVQLIETIQHPYGIAPMKSIIRTSSPVAGTSPSQLLKEPLLGVHLDLPLKPPSALHWTGLEILS